MASPCHNIMYTTNQFWNEKIGVNFLVGSGTDDYWAI